jgi:hypothetical protein
LIHCLGNVLLVQVADFFVGLESVDFPLHSLAVINPENKGPMVLRKGMKKGKEENIVSASVQ